MGNEKAYNKGTDALLALLLNAVVLAALLLIFRPYFETNDDTALLTLVNGAKYSADPHMVISGIWMGRLLMMLYGFTRALPWYTLTQYAMLFLSFTGVTYVLERKLGRVWGMILSLLVTVWFGYESYIVIQFSRTAGIAAASAMFLLFYVVSGMFPYVDRQGESQSEGRARGRASDDGRRRSQVLEENAGGYVRTGYGPAPISPQRMFERRKKEKSFGADHWICLLLGILLAVLSSWLRFTQFLPCAVLTSGIGLWMLLGVIQHHLHESRLAKLKTGRAIEGNRERRRGPVPLALKLAGLFVPFAAALIICLFFRLDDKRSYRQGDVWEDFRTFDIRREELYDYGFPDYASNLEIYREAGISDAGYTLYRNWNFTDPDRFTVEVMDKLIAAKEERHLSAQTLKSFVKTVPKGLIMRPFVWFYLFTLLAYFLSSRGEKKSFLAIIWGLGLFAVLYLYLFYNGRYLRSRVDTALVYALILNTCWFIRPAGVRRTWWIVPALVVCMCLVPGMKQNFRLRQTSGRRVARMEKRREKLEELAADTGHLYVMKMGSVVPNDCYGPLDVMPRKITGNLLYLGGWAAYTKAFCDTMDAYGISNPYRDVIDNEGAYLVDDDIELTLTYLRENYAPQARCEKVGEVLKYDIYRIYSK